MAVARRGGGGRGRRGGSAVKVAVTVALTAGADVNNAPRSTSATTISTSTRRPSSLAPPQHAEDAQFQVISPTLPRRWVSAPPHCRKSATQVEIPDATYKTLFKQIFEEIGFLKRLNRADVQSTQHPGLQSTHILALFIGILSLCCLAVYYCIHYLIINSRFGSTAVVLWVILVRASGQRHTDLCGTCIAKLKSRSLLVDLYCHIEKQVVNGRPVLSY